MATPCARSRSPTRACSTVRPARPAASRSRTAREHFEWEAGHIDGALHIPMMELPDRLGDLPDAHTLAVCKVGSRSAQVVGYLARQGYDVVNLAGGLYDWEAAGRALVSESDASPYVA
ncbi:rhodanese-like domain-containing protein [Nocardioides immobilis]|uniref:Rhodanese-like domain-containing protein n=2 Tax=Nocardioides immobilis TaxID=2049295 RepID=A0A417XZZ3_9ACTN|nr:rhodanese-like domain-containing protein [Nocardioides immobilis]